MAILGATNLTGCNSIPDFIAGGSFMLFQQTSAPTSWTKQTSHNNKALRVVTGTASAGGNLAFTSVFASRPVTGSTGQIAAGGSVGNHTLSLAQIPSHSHASGSSRAGIMPTPFPNNAGQVYRLANANAPNGGGAGSTQAHSHPFAGSQHNHPFSGTALDFRVLFVDVIIARKN